MRSLLVLVAALAFLRAPRAGAGPMDTVKESGRTAGHAVRDGVLTFGRSTRAFFKHGPRAAKQTWQANAATTKKNAHVGKARIKASVNE